MTARAIMFPESPSGYGALFSEPHWISDCGKFRVARFKDIPRKWRLFRRLRINGFAWIGVESGFDSYEEAVAAASAYVAHKRKRKPASSARNSSV